MQGRNASPRRSVQSQRVDTPAARSQPVTVSCCTRTGQVLEAGSRAGPSRAQPQQQHNQQQPDRDGRRRGAGRANTCAAAGSPRVHMQRGVAGRRRELAAAAARAQPPQPPLMLCSRQLHVCVARGPANVRAGARRRVARRRRIPGAHWRPGRTAQLPALSAARPPPSPPHPPPADSVSPREKVRSRSLDWMHACIPTVLTSHTSFAPLRGACAAHRAPDPRIRLALRLALSAVQIIRRRYVQKVPQERHAGPRRTLLR